MGVFAEQIERRDAIDRSLELEADDALEHNLPAATSNLEGARETLRIILEWMHLDTSIALGCKDIDEMLECTLSPQGVMYEEVDMRDQSWRKRAEPLLAQLEDGSFIACRPALSGYSYVKPGSEKAKRLGRNVALREKGWAFCQQMPEGTDTLIEYMAVVMRLLNVRDAIPIVGATALVYLLGLVSPHINRWVLNEIVPQGVGGLELLAMALVAYLTAGFAKLAIQAARTFLLGNVRLRVAGQVEASIMAHILLLPQSYFADQSAGKVSKRLSAARQLSDRLLNLALNLGLTAFFSLGYIPQMMSFGPMLVIPAVTMLIARSLFSVLVALVSVRNEEASMEAYMDSSGFMFSALRGAQKIRTMGAERRVYSRWAAIYRRVLKYDLDQPHILKLENELTSFISSVTTLMLISFVVGAGLSRGDYIAFTASYSLVLAAFEEFLDSMRSIMLMRPLMSQVNDIVNTPLEVGAGNEVLRKVRGEIELDHICFSYPGGLGEIRDLSLKIPAGQKVAFVGESGCGKSTLMKIILGIEKPHSGAVLFDGHSLAYLDVRAYRRHIGSVFQSSKLIPGTVRSNICFVPREVTEEEAWEAAEKACIADDLRAMPLGLDTEISETKSCGFSGGQRQRILLARAFATKPAVMVLDEATSALDNITQKKVLDAVYAEDCTVLMIAHRLSTVVKCDRILVMENGSIAEEGTYDELMARDGAFAKLVRKQIL